MDYGLDEEAVFIERNHHIISTILPELTLTVAQVLQLED